MGGVARIFRPTPPPPAPTPVYASPTKAEISQVTATSAKDISRGKGRTSMIMTKAKGLGDTDLTTQKYSLLGG
jgi:hypothetical protein